jgi:hypothetical protein
MSDEQRQVIRNDEASRYEVHVDGQLAGFAEVRDRQGRVVFTHTEIDDAFEGKGLGSTLAAGALDDVRARGQRVAPMCSFIAGWIDRHPAYAELVDDELMAELRARG